MRDPNKTIAKRTRLKRRAFLAVMIVASSPLLADGPQSNSAMPPLPLKSSMKANPFCLPVAKNVANQVQLASGSSESTIRLKPIGAAIGLQSIGTPGSEAPRSVRPPAMTIEKIPSRVQANPLIRSKHHSNQRLIDASVDDRANGAPTTTVSKSQGVRPIGRRPISDGQKSTLTLIPAAPVAQETPVSLPHTVPTQPVATQPALGQPIPKQRVIAQPSPTQQLTQQPPAIYVPAAKRPAVLAVPNAPAANQQPLTTAHAPVPVSVPNPIPAVVQAVPAVVTPPVPAAVTTPKQTEERSEPVYFSMSDRFDSPATETATPDVVATEIPAPVPSSEEVAATAAPVATEATVETEPAADTQLLMEAREAAVANLDAVAGDAVETESVKIESVDAAGQNAGNDRVQGSMAPLALSEDVDTLKPIHSVLDRAPQEPIAVYQHAVSGPVDSPDETLHTKRYRPPVAVTPVPIAFERLGEEEESSSLVGSTVHSVDSIDFDGIESSTSKLKMTRLVMSRAQVRSLTLGGSVRQVKVADKNICQAFTAGPNQLKLIGTGNGVTRLVVWADTDDTDNPTRMRAFEVHVKDTVEATGDAVGNKAGMLNQSIKKAFPSCNVRVRHQGGKLIVAGRCDSEASAKKVMQMVRKTCLVPAQDELVVR